MRIIARFLTFISLLSLSNFLFAANLANSPLGYWKTIDDISGKAKSIVEITASEKHVLTGRVIKLFEHPEKRCDACKGDMHSKPIVGMAVMTNLRQNTKQLTTWQGGSILDPKNGKTYNCQIQLAKNGEKLTVRGYIGLPLLGRSQTWERVAG